MTRQAATALSAGVAVAAGNAHAFLPARSPVPAALVTLSRDRLTFTGTDTYAVGRAWTGVSGPETDEQAVSACLSRDDLAALEKAARGDKKGESQVTVTHDGVTLVTSDEETHHYAASTARLPDDIWHKVDDLLTRLDGREPVVPEVVAFDPTLLSRFAKVKADKRERVADFYLTDAWEPALVKIGTEFTGAIMPVERETHTRNVGEEGLW